MQAICIRFFVEEGSKHAHQPLREWLFEQARELGIPGGTAFRAAAGYGRHGKQEDTFFELAGKLPESIEFAADEGSIAALIQRVGTAGLKLVYVTHPVRIGVTGSD
jgi:PII-like signaling protein